MAEADATHPGHLASSYGRWQGDDVGLISRIRRPVVAASLMCGDVAAAVIAISIDGTLINAVGLAAPATGDPSLVAVPFLILAFLLVGLYSGAGPSPYERFRLRTIAITGYVVIDLLIALRAAGPIDLLVVGMGKGISLLLFGHYTEALVRAILIRLNLWGAPTAVVGCGDKSRMLARMLMAAPELGLTPIGFIATPGDQETYKIQLPLPLIGTTADPCGDRGHHVDVVMFGSAEDLTSVSCNPQEWMPSCHLLFVESVHDFQSLWLHTRTLGGAIGIEIRRDLCRRYHRLVKRAIDFVLALPLALLACPLIAVLALVIKRIDPGSAFFVQDRVGRNETTLRTFKLRTMYMDAERRLEEYLNRDPQARAEWQRFFKLSHDPRVLPIIGNFMRRSSLDELPQLLNVIRGEMSLVGPRPFPAYHVRSFDDEFRAVRVSVPPGITGLWQVTSRSNGDLQVQKALDLFYIRNWSIWLDVYILLQTVIVVLSGKGAR